MALIVKLRKVGRGHWVYIPTAVMKMLDEPEEFHLKVDDGTIILIPKKE